MAQIAENQYTLESSIKLSRPDFSTYLHSDVSTGGTDIAQKIQHVHDQRLHIPNKVGMKNYDEDCCNSIPGRNPSDEMPIMTTLRPNEVTLVDPVSGFLSVSGEIILNTGKLRMDTMGKPRIEPHTTIPQYVNSIRGDKEAIDELKRSIYGQDDAKLNWNSRKVPDAVLRARLGGWTSEFNPLELKKDQKIIQRRIEELFPNMKLPYKSIEERQHLSNIYTYTSSAQNAYEDINWDAKLPPRLHAPVTTNEYGLADPLKKNDDLYKRPQLWQTVGGKAWDRLQEREPEFHKEKPEFAAPNKRANQIPGYAGSFGGVNIERMDDKIETFNPFTVVRTEQPRPADPAYKPNIPGYTGHIHNFKTTPVSHFDNQNRAYTTYATYHRDLPNVKQNMPPISSLNGDFLRILTKVPPQNPYNLIEMKTDPFVNHSLDHEYHPISNVKDSLSAKYLAKNREAEIQNRKNSTHK